MLNIRSYSCAAAVRSSRLEGLWKIGVTLLIRKPLKVSSSKGHFYVSLQVDKLKACNVDKMNLLTGIFQ